MFSDLSSFARTSVIAIAAVAWLPPVASAAPLGPIGLPAAADDSAPIPVAQGEGRGGGPGYQRFWPRNRGNWNGGGWNGRHWNGGGNWRRGGYWRRGGWGPGFALGLGLGLPLGYYGGYNDNYYDGYYDEPVYRPRVYRTPRYYRRYRDDSYNGPIRDNCDNEYLTGPKFSGCQNR